MGRGLGEGRWEGLLIYRTTSPLALMGTSIKYVTVQRDGRQRLRNPFITGTYV